VSSSLSASIVFSRSSPLLEVSSPTVDNFSSSNHRRTAEETEDDLDISGSPSRTTHDIGDGIVVVDKSYEQDSKETESGADVVVLVSVIMFIICSYIPCIHPFTI
jgi:hypothetical protein